MKRELVLLAVMAIILVAIPLTLFISQQQTKTDTHASASTTLTLTPATNNKQVGDPIPLDIMINPGTNAVTFVKLQVQFDPSKITLTPAGAFVPNTTAFPVTIEGPIASGSSIAVSVSVGSDPTKAITQPTKLGTINFLAGASTGTSPTQVSFTSITQALSVASTDQAGQNVISTTSPASITIGGAIPSTTPVPTGTSTLLQFNLLLHGVGNAGDNPNPKGASLSNKTPLHPQRNFQAQLINANNEPLSELSGAIIYDESKGNFVGQLDLGTTFPSGNYSIKIKTDRYLRKLAPGIIKIETLKVNDVPETSLVAGDVKADNILNVLDYNILRDCGYGVIDPLPLADPNAVYNSTFCASHNSLRPNADIDDNGIVNSSDYNLFLRELSVQNGD